MATVQTKVVQKAPASGAELATDPKAEPADDAGAHVRPTTHADGPARAPHGGVFQLDLTKGPDADAVQGRHKTVGKAPLENHPDSRKQTGPAAGFTNGTQGATGG